MLQLLQQRTKFTAEIGRLKRRHRAVIYVPDRERDLVARLVRRSKGQPSARVVTAVYREILSGSRAAQGQPPIGLLEASAGSVRPAARAAFGACDEFVSRKTWPDLAKDLRARRLSLALVTSRDLLEALRMKKSWREFTAHLCIAGEIEAEKTAAKSGRILIVTPHSGSAASTVNRMVILIECKSTLNAIKSLLRSMPAFTLSVPPCARADSALVQVETGSPLKSAQAEGELARAVRRTGLPITLLGAYLAPESHGG